MAVLRHVGTCFACGGSTLVQFSINRNEFEHRWACPKCLTVRKSDQAGFLTGHKLTEEKMHPRSRR